LEQAQPGFQSGEQHFCLHGSYEVRVELNAKYPDWLVRSPSTQGLELHPAARTTRAAAIRRFMGRLLSEGFPPEECALSRKSRQEK